MSAGFSGPNVRRQGSTLGTESPMGMTVLHAPDITCGLCAGSISDAVRAVPGVEAVSVDVVSQRVVVAYDEPADEGLIRLALQDAGRDVGAAAG